MADDEQAGMIYELWDYQTSHLLWTYATRAEALAAVRDAIERYGRDYVAAWAIGRGDDGGWDEPIIDGPELNPDEGVWNLLKRRELKNRCCQTIDDLRWELGLAIRRLQRRPQLLRACVVQCGYV